MPILTPFINFTGQKFLGASILDFNCTLGKGPTPSSLNVRLVEDFSSGDLFIPPAVGSPVYFNFTGDDTTWFFGGLLQSYEKVSDTSANPIYEVFVNDPRELLSKTTVILSGYNGTVQGVPNLINAYGYIENTTGFGSAQVNDSGIPWRTLVTAINQIMSSNSIYGGPISFRGHTYRINTIGSMPNLPDDYRIGGDSIDLFSLVAELCEVGSLDFYFTLISNIITLNTISTLQEVQAGSIINFVNTTPGAKSKRLGIQARHDVTGKFVVGGDVVRQFIQTRNDGEDGSEDDTIMQYWGTDLDGNLIVGEGEGDDHTFTLDTRHIDIPGVGASYTTNIAEMRAVLRGQSSWEAFLCDKNGNKYKVVKFGGDVQEEEDGPEDIPNADYYYEPIIGDKQLIGVQPSRTKKWREFVNSLALAQERGEPLPVWDGSITVRWYLHNEEPNIFYMRAAQLGMVGSFRTDLQYRWVDPEISLEEFLNLNPLEMSPFKGTQIKLASDNRDNHEEHKRVLYDFLAEYANQYYGKRYMVRIPFVLAAVDPFTPTDNIDPHIKTSLEPADAGYIDESDWSSALSLNLIPSEIDTFLVEDGRISPYVRFDNLEEIDFSNLAEEDFALNMWEVQQGNKTVVTASIFIKCSLHPYIVFLDKTTAFSPRVVIELPTQILSADLTKRESFSGNFAGIVADHFKTFIPRKAEQRRLQEPELYEKFVTAANAAQNIQEAIDKYLEDVGGNIYHEAYGGLAKTPSIASVPLKSNIQVYGPYYNIGIEGKVDFQKDESLVPWNYGSYTLMNLAGEARVGSVSSQGYNESGLVEVPGTPTINIGQRLVALGPLVTDIRVSIGPQGVLTTYIMNNFGPRFGVNRQGIDTLREQAKLAQQARRKFRKLLRHPAPPQSKYYQKRAFQYIKRKESKSSHAVFAASMKGENISVFTSPAYHAVAEIKNNYYDKSIVSLDTLFSPISLNPEYSGTLPKFQEPTQDGINSLLLNPFPKTTGDYLSNSVITAGNELPEEGLFHRDNLHRSGDFRILALRGPLIIHGFGFDTEGRPVPNDDGDFEADIPVLTGTSDHFASGFLARPSIWPVGPLDVRWDDKRKVWSSSANFSIVKPTTDVQPRTAELCTFYTGPRNSMTVQRDSEEELIQFHCFNADTERVIVEGTECLAIPFSNLGVSSFEEDEETVFYELIPLQC